MLPKEKVVAGITFVLRCAMVNVSHQGAALWVKKRNLDRKLQISDNFDQTTDMCSCTFSAAEIWVLKRLFLPLNFVTMGDLSPKFCIFGRKISDMKRCFNNFPTTQNLGCLPEYEVTATIHVTKYVIGLAKRSKRLSFGVC